MRVETQYNESGRLLRLIITAESNSDQSLLHALKQSGSNALYVVELADVDVERKQPTITFSVPFK